MGGSDIQFTEAFLARATSRWQSRLDFWAEFIETLNIRSMAEVGVYRGDFAASMLRQCESLTRYYMIDPWRHLKDWNKPQNVADSTFAAVFEEAKAATDFAAGKRTILRGKTIEVADQITDGELDLVYIDGDHTLKGAVIDLIRMYPKVRVGGFLGGDDLDLLVWKHGTTFEPSMVFPVAIHFAEAVGATIYALPDTQFLIHKTGTQRFAFIDLTGRYKDLGVRDQFTPDRLLRVVFREQFPRLWRAAVRAKFIARVRF
jgi:hypothetical protein